MGKYSKYFQLSRGNIFSGYSGTVIQNKQISTIDVWGPEYRVAVDIIVNSATTANEYYSILRFTSTDSDCCNIGDRVPLIFYRRGGSLTFVSAVGENGNFYFHYSIDLKKWYHIEMSQAKKNGKVRKKTNVSL